MARRAREAVPGSTTVGGRRSILSIPFWRSAMRKVFPLLGVAAITSGLVWAAEVKTIVGEAVCAKCALKESQKCQNTITTEEGGKKVTYYLTKNQFFGAAHKDLGICTAKPGSGPKVKATGEVAEKDGKMTLTPTKPLESAD
jgi:hypothetical protein